MTPPAPSMHIRDVREIEPLLGPIDADVVVPGSKSFTNRALVTAALADGVSTLSGVLFSDDTEAMLGCLDALGIAVDIDRAAHVVRVHGSGGNMPVRSATLDVRQSGTTARFVVPMLAASEGEFVVDGHAQMRARPMAELARVLEESEVRLETDDGRLPFTVHGRSRRVGGSVAVRGDASSQFLSGLLLSAPLWRGGLTIELTSTLVSVPYVVMTIATMRAFGIEVGHDASLTRFVVPEGTYRATTFAIEPDASAASYFFGAAAITGGRVRIDGLGTAAIQGDIAFVENLRSMGATVSQGPDWTEVCGPRPGALRGGAFDLSGHSDTAPTLAAVAAFADAPVEITHVGFIRFKETDRIAAVVSELRRCGVDATELADGIRVVPGLMHGADIETYDDHRMAMSMALLGLRVPGIRILDPGCVAKTFPDYFDVLDALRDGAASTHLRAHMDLQEGGNDD